MVKHKLLILAFISIACISTWQFIKPVPCHKDVDCTWDAFYHIAFGDEFNEDKLIEIIKWNDPIRIAVQTDMPEFHVPLVEGYVLQLKKHLSIPITILNTEPDGANGFNIIVIFSDDFDRDIYGRYKKDLYELYGNSDYIFKRYEKLKSKNSSCAMNISVDTSNAIVLGIALIPSNHNPKELKGCIAEEMSQSLGLPNDYVGFKESLFNDLEGYSELQPLDWLMLKILYHPKIKRGMTPDQVKIIFEDVYNEVVEGQEW